MREMRQCKRLLAAVLIVVLYNGLRYRGSGQ